MTNFVTPISAPHKRQALRAFLPPNPNYLPALISKIILFGLLLLAYSGFSQSITVTGVSPSTVCAGSNVTITFSTTNGNGSNNYYSNTTTYTPYLSTSTGTFPGTTLSNFTTSGVTYTSGNGLVTNNITFNITIPSSASSGSYKISLGSSGSNNPSFNGINGAGASPSFTINPQPQGSLSANGPFCASGSGTLTWTATAGTGPFTVVYNDGVADRTVSGVTSGTSFAVFTTPVSASTTYTLVSVTDANCQRTSGFTGGSPSININPLPTIALSSAATSVCYNVTSTSLSYSATTNAPTSYSITWNSTPANSFVTATDAALPASPIGIAIPAGTAAGTYTGYLTVKNANGCISAVNTFTVGVNTLPTDPGNPTSNSPQCADVGVTLTQAGSAPGGETWFWQTTSTGTSTASSGTTYNVTASGTYYLRSRNNTTLCWSSGAGSLAVVVNTLPANPANPTSNSPQCVDVGVTLTRNGTPPGTETWFWQTTSTGTNTASSGTTYNVTASGTYYLRARNNTTLCWSSGAGSLAVVVNTLPANPANPTSNSPQCVDVGVTLTRNGTPPGTETWFWQTGSGGTNTVSSASTYNVSASGTYYIRARNNTTLCWSSGEGSLAVVVNTLPATPANPTSNSPQCADVGVTLTQAGSAPGGETWFWQTSSGGTSTAASANTYNVTASGTYYLRSRNNTTSCWSSSAGSLAVVVNTLPTNPGNPTSNSPQCADVGVTLTRNGTPPGTETWYWQTSSGGTSTAASANTYNVTASGTYYIRARNNTTLCWSSGEGSLAVVVNTLPANPSNPTSNSPQCVDVGVTLTQAGSAPGGETWFWQTSSTGTNTASSGTTYNVSASGTYYLRARNNTTLCWSSSAGSLAVVVNTLPVATLVATESSGVSNNDNIICAGSNVTFTATAGFTTYNFKVNGSSVQNGSSNIYNTTALTNGASVTVDITNSNNCQKSFGPVNISVNPIPNVLASPTSQNICSGSTGVINFSGTGTTFSWNRDNPANSGGLSNGTGNVNTSFSNSGTAPLTLNFNVTVTANGCSATVNSIASVQVLPVPTVNAVTSQTVCHNGSTTAVNFSGTGTSYTWTNSNAAIGLATSGSGNISFSPTNAGTSPIAGSLSVTPVYTVGGTNCNGSPQPFSITVNPLPVLTSTQSPSKLNVCSGSPFSYAPTTSATGVTTTFNWSRATVAGISNGFASGTGSPGETLLNTTTGDIDVIYVYTLSASNNSISCSSPTSYNVIVTVKPTPTVAVNPAATQSICTLSSTAPITLSNNTPGLVGTLTWSRDNTGNITGTSSGSGNIPAIPLTNITSNIQTTVFTATSTLNGCSTSTTVNVQVNPVISSNVIAGSTVLEGEICSIAKQVTFTSPPASGGDGTFTYQWQVNYTGNSDNWEDIPGATGQSLSSYTYPIQNAFFRRIAYSDGCSSLISDEYHINPPITGGFTQTVLNGGAYCAGGTGITVTLNGSLAGATYTLQYEQPANSNNWISAPGFSPIIGTGSSISFVGITVAGNYRIQGVVSVGTGCTTYFNEFTVSINALPNTPTVNSPAAICAGASTNIIGYTSANNILVNWYTADLPGGTLINSSPLTGSPSGSAVGQPVTPSTTTTYYAQAINTTTGCLSGTRTPVTVTVNQKPNITNTNPAPICSQSTITIVLANDIVANGTSGLSYSWVASDNSNTTGETFTPAQSTSTISNTITNNVNSQQTVNYTVTATYPSGCVGNSKVIAVTVDPKPVIASFTNAGVCSGNQFTATIPGSNTVPTSPVTQYTWTDPTVTGLGGGSAQNTPQTSISQTLTNSTSATINAVYTVTPTAGSCTGANFTLTVPVYPKPFVNPQSTAVCSGFPFTISPADLVGGNIVPANTVYAWNSPTGSFISGYNLSLVSNQPNINGTVTNTSSPGVPTTATYTVTPTGPAAMGSCQGSNFTATVTINPIPTATIAGTTAVCQGASSPNITFTGNNGIQPYTFTYTITVNGVTGLPQTISTSAGNSVTTPASTATSGTIVYSLTKVADAGSTGCNQNLSTSATVTVNPAPSASISGDATICPGSSSTVTISIPGTGFHSGTLNPGGIAFSGSAPSISVIVSPSVTTTYTIASLTNSTCPALAANLTGSATVTLPPSGMAGTWTCFVSSDWFDCRNWANGVVPTNTTDVVINSSTCNPVIDPASLYAPADKIARAGNVTISAGRNLSFNGSGNLYVAGNWTNNAGATGFTAGSGTVTFMGSSGAGCTQTINTTGSSESFYNLVINNTCSRDAVGQGDNVSLSKPVNVSGTFTLTDGIVQTTSANILTITNPAVGAVVGGSNNSYVNGPLARNTNSTGVYTFPVGNPAGTSLYGTYRPVQVTPSASTSTSFTAQYYTGTPPAGALLGPTGILTTEYWNVQPSSSCATSAVVGLYYNNPNNASHWTGGVGPCSTCNVAIAKPAPSAWYFTDYPDYVGSGFNGTIPEDRAYTNNGWIYTKPVSCTGFQSPYFTFGYNYSAILPVKLTSFEGKLQNRDALLHWMVADINELAGFELQHSNTGSNFKKLAYINSTSSKNYQYTDLNLATGAHFYRLVLLDKNGQSTYSKTLLLVVGKNVTLVNNIRPNPVDNIGYINIWSASRQKVRIDIYDMAGRLMSQQSGSLAEGSNELPLKTHMLAQGVYNVLIRTEDQVQKNLRIMKE